LEVAAARSARYGWAFTLVLVDLQQLQGVNDRSGHEYGNHLLRRSASPFVKRFDKATSRRASVATNSPSS